MRCFKFIIPSDASILQERDDAEPFEWSGLMLVVIAADVASARALGKKYLDDAGDLSDWLRFAEVEETAVDAPAVVAFASI